MYRINELNENNKGLLRYSMQLAMLNSLKNKQLLTDKEYITLKNKLKTDYNVISEIST